MKCRLIQLVVLLIAAACPGGGSSAVAGPTNDFLSTKTPYEPPAKDVLYELPPRGYRPVFTEMVARHGARALTSETDIKYLEQLISLATAENALTSTGSHLSSQVQSLEEANIDLKYGNLSPLGIKEHRGLATRLRARLTPLFESAVKSGRKVMVVSSGVGRAVESAQNFTDSLRAAGFPKDLILPPVTDDRPWTPETNKTLLYFFKTDPPGGPYQRWLANNAHLHDTLKAILYSEESHREARQMLEQSFTSSFVDKLAAGKLRFTNPAKGPEKDKTVTKNEVDLAISLYHLYQNAPGLAGKGTWSFADFVPEKTAGWFAYVNDAQEFYQKGPSFEGETITYTMAQVLQDDFFLALEAGCANGAVAAYLRFAHAETVIPFAALMQLPGSQQPAKTNDTYQYDNNPWRGAQVSPYAANIQWDAFRNDHSRTCIVRMLYNEEQTRFKPACQSIRPDSFFYEVSELALCYHSGRVNVISRR